MHIPGRLGSCARCPRHLHTSTRKATRSSPSQATRLQNVSLKPKSSSPRSKPFPSPSPSPPGYETADVIFKARKFPLLAAGVVALGCGIYFSMIVSSFIHDDCASDEATPTGRPPTFTRESARHFDRSLDASETSMGITSLRHDLGKRAFGHVLEVALGTGRNMSFYDWTAVAPAPSLSSGSSVRADHPTSSAPLTMASFTGVDVSADMLGVAIDKLPVSVPGLTGLSPTVSTQSHQQSSKSWTGFSYLGGKVRLAQCDIQESLPSPDQHVTSGQKYDTVIQTFGLCSVTQPDKVVRNLAGMVKPGTGRIYLVEHGKSWWNLVNALLDWSAPSHFKKYGCWWNRDIVDIVQNTAASVPGLKIVRIERPFVTQLGTTVWVELLVEQ